jgi:hypothetical protein
MSSGEGSGACCAELPAWDGFDLGEPAFFRAHGRSYSLYVGMRAEASLTRSGSPI